MKFKIGFSKECLAFTYGNTKEKTSFWNGKEKRVEIEMSFDEVYELFRDKLNQENVSVYLLDQEKPRLITKISKVGIYATYDF